MKYEIRCPKCNNFLGDVAVRWIEKAGVWEARGSNEPKVYDDEPQVAPDFYECKPLLKLRDDFDRDPQTGVYS